jgi:HEAT repeat protein
VVSFKASKNKSEQFLTNEDAQSTFEALNFKDNPNVRLNAIDLLLKIGKNKGADAFIEALKDSNEFVRQRAANSLGIISEKKAVDILIASALKDREMNVRYKSIDALKEIADEKA